MVLDWLNRNVQLEHLLSCLLRERPQGMSVLIVLLQYCVVEEGTKIMILHHKIVG